MTPAPCESWFLNAAILSRVYLAIHLLLDALAGPWKFNCASGMIAITEVLLGASIASGTMVPFAAGLVFFGALISKIPAYHLHFSRVVPDPWEMTVVLATSAILMCSAWITKFAERLSVPHQFELLGRHERSKAEVDLFDENVAITIRIDDRGFDIFRRPRCTVTIRFPKNGVCSAERRAGDTPD